MLRMRETVVGALSDNDLCLVWSSAGLGQKMKRGIGREVSPVFGVKIGFLSQLPRPFSWFEIDFW